MLTFKDILLILIIYFNDYLLYFLWTLTLQFRNPEDCLNWYWFCLIFNLVWNKWKRLDWLQRGRWTSKTFPGQHRRRLRREEWLRPAHNCPVDSCQPHQMAGQVIHMLSFGLGLFLTKINFVFLQNISKSWALWVWLHPRCFAFQWDCPHPQGLVQTSGCFTQRHL